MDMANKVADKACPGQRFVLIVHNPGALEASGEQPESIMRMFLLGQAFLMQHMHVPSLKHVPRCQPNPQLHLVSGLGLEPGTRLRLPDFDSNSKVSLN